MFVMDGNPETNVFRQQLNKQINCLMISSKHMKAFDLSATKMRVFELLLHASNHLKEQNETCVSIFLTTAINTI